MKRENQITLLLDFPETRSKRKDQLHKIHLENYKMLVLS